MVVAITLLKPKIAQVFTLQPAAVSLSPTATDLDDPEVSVRRAGIRFMLPGGAFIERTARVGDFVSGYSPKGLVVGHLCR